MTRRWYALILTAALVIGFAGVNLAAYSLLRGVRIDLTDNRAFTLSQATKTTIDALAEPIDLTFYYSRAIAAERPEVRAYAERVRELLRAYAARASGKIRLREIDPRPYSREEDLAIAAGVEGIDTRGEDTLYFGLTGSNAVGETNVIPVFIPHHEPFLEYELTRMVSRLDAPRTPKVAVVTSLSLPDTAGWMWAELTRNFDVTVLPADFTAIPPDTDVLVAAHPGPLDTRQLYAVDQYVMARGRAVIFVDPVAKSAALRGGFAASGLEPLLSRWGVRTDSRVVMDRSMALPVNELDAAGRPQTARQPLYLRLMGDALSPSDISTGALSRGVHVAAAGALSLAPGLSGVALRPLLETSTDSMVINGGAAMAGVSPSQAMAAFRPSGVRFMVAGRLTGVLPSAFQAGPPVDPGAQVAPPTPAAPEALTASPPAPIAPTPRAPAPPLARSAAPVNLVIVADTDLLDDGFYVDPATRTPVADNAAFVVNVVDNLSGSDALSSLRARAPADRPLTRIDAMRGAALERLVREQETLERRLAETEGRLDALKKRGATSGFFDGDVSAPLTAEEQAEVERFRDQALATRRALREVQGALRRDIEGLRATLVAINVWAMPLAVVAFGIFLVVSRRRLGGRG
jgi:ABC-type uncharacterized transport system involved in gliding motility auxiliary subunit